MENSTTYGAVPEKSTSTSLASLWRRFAAGLGVKQRQPEPRLSHTAASVAAEVAAAAETQRARPVLKVGEPATLRELGVPGPLAAEMELVMGLMNQGGTGRYLGYTFCTPDGVLHRLRRERDERSEEKAA